MEPLASPEEIAHYEQSVAEEDHNERVLMLRLRLLLGKCILASCLNKGIAKAFTIGCLIDIYILGVRVAFI